MSEELIKRLTSAANAAKECGEYYRADLFREAADALSSPAPAVQVQEGEMPWRKRLLEEFTHRAQALCDKQGGHNVTWPEFVQIFTELVRLPEQKSGKTLAESIFGEEVCHYDTESGCVVGVDTSRVIAEFSHRAEAEAAVENWTAPAPVATEALALPKGRNSFGLDMAYFGSKMGRILRDLSSYKPDEFARECARMAATADAAVLRESEFLAEAVAQGCAYCLNRLYAGTKCRVCGRESEFQAEKAVAQGGGVYDLDADRPRAIKTADQLQRLPVVSEAAAMTIDDALTHLTWPEFENDEPRFLYSAARALGDEVVRLRALLSASPAGVGGWQPIETAPKDGTVMLLRNKKWRMADGYWMEANSTCGAWIWPYVKSEPTHWLPLNTLPAAPAIANQGEGE